ncbi:MAG: dihydrodipicolinate synthase family protein [Spirochaetes bacterium]|nr:dihydrodipicolinate synthase family protein [Spirochaetota bacterium]
MTPMKDGKIDGEGLDKLIEHVLAGGVHGLFLLGTTGEGPSLSQGQKIQMVRRAGAQVKKRVPIIVAITDTVVEDTLELAQVCAKAGADALVVAPPYYLPPGPAEFLAYLDQLLPALPLPLFLYNMPSMTKVSLDTPTLAEALARPGVIGVKDSSGDMGLFHKLLSLRAAEPRPRGWAFFTGSETLLAESVLFGAQGGVCGGANVDPALFVELFEAALARRMDRILALQGRLMALSAIYGHGHHASSGIKGIKCALSLLDVCGDGMAAPFAAFAGPERQQVARDLGALGLIPR